MRAVLLLLVAGVTLAPTPQFSPQSSPQTSVDSGRQAEELRRLALADQQAGERAAAAAKLTDALALFERADDRSGQARTLVQRGALTASADDLRRALDLYQALGDEEGLLLTYNYIVHVLRAGAEKDRLRAEGLALARRTSSRAVECVILHQWGDEHFNAGRFAESFQTLTEAQACFQETPDRGREGRVLVSLGRLHRAHGRLSRALDHYVRALALQEQVKDEPAAIQSVNAIAVTLGTMGKTDESLVRYEEALGRARAIRLPQLNVLRGNLGGAYLELGRYREAEALLAEALAAETSPFIAVTREVQLARAWGGLGDLDEALAHADRAVERARSLAPPQQLVARNSRAHVLIERRRFADAATDLEISMGLIERMRANTVPDDYMKQGFSEAHQYVFAALIDSMQAQGRHREALETAERARSRAFLDLLATRRDHGGEARAAATSTLPAAAPDLPVAQAAPLDSSRSSPPATVDDIVGAARRLRSTFLCYWVGAASTSIWVIAPDGRIVSKTVAAPAAKLVALVAEATGDDDETRADEGAGITTGATRSDVIGSGGSARRPWRELHRLLIEPVRSALPSAPGSRLTIVPHGPLLRLSFAGLRDASGRYLIESHDLHYVPAAAVLAFTKRERSPGKSGSPGTGGSETDLPRTNGGSLLVGDPGELAGDAGGAMLNALPWARREVEAVRRVVSQPATVLVGEQAGEGAVRRALAHRSLLHLATHGIVRSEETLTSYLALRPDGETADGDGRLTADEVYALSIEADLVVLSACRSALGPTTGDGVIGFTRAFLSAGAASVVATMWDVPDRTTYEVMRRFHLRRAAGAGKSRSLRVSQLAVLSALREGRIRIDGTTLPETPRLWAGFVLVGEP